MHAAADCFICTYKHPNRSYTTVSHSSLVEIKMQVPARACQQVCAIAGCCPSHMRLCPEPTKENFTPRPYTTRRFGLCFYRPRPTYIWLFRITLFIPYLCGTLLHACLYCSYISRIRTPFRLVYVLFLLSALYATMSAAGISLHSSYSASAAVWQLWRVLSA